MPRENEGLMPVAVVKQFAERLREKATRLEVMFAAQSAQAAGAKTVLEIAAEDLEAVVKGYES